jgi:hypothetical protein
MGDSGQNKSWLKIIMRPKYLGDTGINGSTILNWHCADDNELSQDTV